MRLFVAVDLPDEVKTRLERMRSDIPGAVWVKRHALHLTLQFLGGDIPAARLPDIRTALAGVAAAAFELALDDVGRFPPNRRQPPRVLWVGFTRPAGLGALYEQVTRATGAVGFAPDDRGFSPHVTLARLKRPDAAPQAEAFLVRHQGFRTAPFPVRQFVLFSSLLTPEGSRYTQEGVYRLNG